MFSYTSGYCNDEVHTEVYVDGHLVLLDAQEFGGNVSSGEDFEDNSAEKHEEKRQVGQDEQVEFFLKEGFVVLPGGETTIRAMLMH